MRAARGTMIQMHVSQLTVDPFTSMPILILKDEGERHALPVSVGLIEASAIASEIEKIALDRPQAHDLMRELIGRLSVKLERVEIRDVRDRKYFATLFLSAPGKKRMQLDARPSDAIALALRTGAPIYVARKVIERAQRIELPDCDAHGGGPGDGGAGDFDLAEAARLKELLETMSDEEFGKWKM
jgi:uncharacterized protein